MGLDRELRILFVCTANVCRSPLAAAFMTAHAAAVDVNVTAASASVDDEQRRVHPMVLRILDERGIVRGRELSRPLSAELLERSDLIVTMTGDHAIAVAARFRDATTKVFMLDHLVQLLRPLRADETLDEWLAELRDQPRSYPRQPGAQDVADPIGSNEPTFRAIGDRIDGLTRRIAGVLATTTD